MKSHTDQLFLKNIMQNWLEQQALANCQGKAYNHGVSKRVVLNVIEVLRSADIGYLDGWADNELAAAIKIADVGSKTEAWLSFNHTSDTEVSEILAVTSLYRGRAKKREVRAVVNYLCSDYYRMTLAVFSSGSLIPSIDQWGWKVDQGIIDAFVKGLVGAPWEEM